MKSQNARILERLKTGRALTFIDAEAMHIHRLAARVHDLKEAGHNIKSTPINYKGTRMACYWMGVKQ